VKRVILAGGALAVVLAGLAVGRWTLEREADPVSVPTSDSAPSTAAPPAATHPAAESDQGFLYGRITTIDGATYEGRLRWGGREEAFWGDPFNGSKVENPWAAHVPPDRLPTERRPIRILGVEIAHREQPLDLRRPFVARMGDIARIEARGRDVRVTLKSGSVFDLDRFSASDFDDGLRVWDNRRGVVDLDSLRIRTIELLPTPALGAAPYRLYGTVRTQQGEFTGFVQWDRADCVGTDELRGRTDRGEFVVRFDTIGAIARRSRDGSLVTLLDGREIVLSDTRQVGRGNRGIHVEDPRYGAVSISWDVFERIDFGPGGSGPAYGDFPAGSPLRGSVTTRAGERLAGRLVYDLDEGETTETLDAPARGVSYSIPFGLIASIVPSGREEGGAPRAIVTLRDGEELRLEHGGDLGETNAGMLIFVEGRPRPEYLPWTEVRRVEFDRPPAMYPPLDER